MQISAPQNPGHSGSAVVRISSDIFHFHSGVPSPAFSFCCDPVWGNIFQCDSSLTDIWALQNHFSGFWFSILVSVFCCHPFIDFFL